MNYATFSKSVFAVTAVLIAAACANSADVPASSESSSTVTASTNNAAPAADKHYTIEHFKDENNRADGDLKATVTKTTIDAQGHKTTEPVDCTLPYYWLDKTYELIANPAGYHHNVIQRIKVDVS